MPSDLLPFLKDLASLPGLSVHDNPVRDRIRREWDPLVDEIRTSRLGNLHGIKHGSSPGPRSQVLISAPMDAIRLMVVEIVDGCLRLQGIGGLDPRTLLGLPVVVHGLRALPGTIVRAPEGSPAPSAGEGAPTLEHLLVDVGLPPRQVNRYVQPGHIVTFAFAPFPLGEDYLAGQSLSTRAPVAALTACLLELQRRSHLWDVVAVATVDEGEAFGAALTSAYVFQPDIAIAVGSANGQPPGGAQHQGFALGKGPANGWGPSIHPGIHREIQRAAQREEIELVEEIMPVLSGTDAEGLQTARAGIPTGAIGIPIRYRHSSIEVVALPDIRRTGRVLASFVTGLTSDFAKTLSWD